MTIGIPDSPVFEWAIHTQEEKSDLAFDLILHKNWFDNTYASKAKFNILVTTRFYDGFWQVRLDLRWKSYEKTKQDYKSILIKAALRTPFTDFTFKNSVVNVVELQTYD